MKRGIDNEMAHEMENRPRTKVKDTFVRSGGEGETKSFAIRLPIELHKKLQYAHIGQNRAMNRIEVDAIIAYLQD